MAKNNNSPLSSFLKQAGIISLIGIILLEIVTYVDRNNSEEAIINDEIAASLPTKQDASAALANAPHALNISYQGASGFLPASSLESTTAATTLGANFINLKVALTKDQIVVVAPSLDLSLISNIAKLYPNAGQNGHYLISDFTYNQLKEVTLTANVPNSTKTLDYHIATLSEHLEVIKDLSKDLNKHVGVFPQLLQAKYYLAHKQDLALSTIKVLQKYKFTSANSVYLVTDSFDALKQTRADLMKLKVDYQLVQLIDNPNTTDGLDNKYLAQPQDLVSADGLAKISDYANGIAITSSFLITKNGDKLNVVNNSFTQKLELDKTLSVFPYLVSNHEQVLSKEDIQKYFQLLNQYKFNIIGVITPYPNQKFYFQK